MKPERIEAIYDELGTLVIELEVDPAAKGPAHMQDLISRTRGYLNRTSRLLHEVHREHHALEREHDALEAAFNVSSDQLLAEDARVTRLPNIDDRKAMINLLLREERLKILDLKREIKELSFVEKAVRHRHKELDNTMSSIRMQKSLIDAEIRTGAFYGDENDASRGSLNGRRSPVADDLGEEELSALLGEVTAAPPAQEVKPAPVTAEPAPQPVVVPASPKPNIVEKDAEEDPDFAKFLEGDDYSDVLATLDL